MTYTEEIARFVSPGQDHTERFEYDQEIRKAGYAIHSRIAGQEPIWERKGIKYPQSDVIMREGL